MRKVLLDGLVIDASDDTSLQFALPLWWQGELHDLHRAQHASPLRRFGV